MNPQQVQRTKEVGSEMRKVGTWIIYIILKLARECHPPKRGNKYEKSYISSITTKKLLSSMKKMRKPFMNKKIKIQVIPGENYPNHLRKKTKISIEVYKAGSCPRMTTLQFTVFCSVRMCSLDIFITGCKNSTCFKELS